MEDVDELNQEEGLEKEQPLVRITADNKQLLGKESKQDVANSASDLLSDKTFEELPICEPT